MKVIILDSTVLKARRVLRARLSKFGYEILPYKSPLPKAVIEEYAKKGAIVVTSSSSLAYKTNGIFIHPEIVSKHNSRTLATLIIKLITKKMREK